MKYRETVAIVVGLVVLVAATARAVGVGEVMPAFEIKTLEGRIIKSAEVKDHSPMMLMFWATWCPYCLREIPRFKELYAKYSPKGMVFVAINPGINDSEAKIEKYIKKYQIEYPIAFDKGAVVTKKFQVRGAPTFVVVDKRGIVRYRGGTIPADFGDHFAALEK